MADFGLRHPIKVVSERTGLTAHVIRSWEKRYSILQPERSGGNQRLYREEDIELLLLLRQATEAGHPIRTVAKLSEDKLRSLLNAPSRATTPEAFSTETPARRSSPPARARTGPELVESCLSAISAMNAAELESILDEAGVSLGQVALLNQVICPLVHRIGDGWQQGSLKVAHEHLASAVIRTFLGNAARPFAVHASAPMLICTTPSGQIHEIGAALAAAAASNHGWRVTYLGPSLPAEEIASAVLQSHSRAVALSIVHPADDPQLSIEIKRLRRLLPASIPILVGGAAASAYHKTLRSVGATVCDSLSDFTDALDELRQGLN
jgi:MerR family transcriptional regulator, light-induced transcriptional regulator